MRIDPTTGLPTADTQTPIEGEKRFDLDFSAGTPSDLVKAVEKAAQIPVNVIIPGEHHDFFLPPLKLRNVTISQLFHSIGVASRKSEYRRNANWVQPVTTSYGFRTTDDRPTTNSIWYFYVEGQSPAKEPQPPPAPQVRFWNLETYLERLKVEDITTGIETGWKMLGVNPLPKLTFHKDTKLLVVLGQPEQLSLIDDVLRELRPAGPPMVRLPAPSAAPNNASEKPGKP